MRYPMIRENKDGSLVAVRNPEEAYADPDQIARFRPELPVPEEAPEDPAEDVPEAPKADEPKRGPGRPKKVVV